MTDLLRGHIASYGINYEPETSNFKFHAFFICVFIPDILNLLISKQIPIYGIQDVKQHKLQEKNGLADIECSPCRPTERVNINLLSNFQSKLLLKCPQRKRETYLFNENLI